MYKTIVVELTTKGLEIASVEVFGEELSGKRSCGVKDQQASTTPLDEPRLLFSLQHVVQASHELVEASSRRGDCQREVSGAATNDDRNPM